ncbi:MAG: YaiI/YqxD family protein [Pseudomonadota bacterium]
MNSRLRILVDADACPVKEEVYKVAFRYSVPVTVVANQPIRIPRHELINRVTVTDGYDAADDHVAQVAHAGTIVITADILLAERCLNSDATVIAPNGKPFTKDTIGSAIAARALMADLRAGAESPGGGPPPFQKSDRSRFLSTLDEAVVRLRRGA